MQKPHVETIATPVLEIAYEEYGERSARPIVLFHGWPDDVRTWDSIAPELAQRGYHVVVPYLRGFGATRFRSPATPRSGQNSAIGQDAADLLAALDLKDAVLAGHDWGARCAYGGAILASERVRAVVSIAVPYGSNMATQTMSYAQVQAYWYHWFFSLERGRQTLENDRAAFCRNLWRGWSPGWQFSDEEFARTAISWQNADFVAITVHSYRHRWGNDVDDPQYAEVNKRIVSLPPMPVPVISLFGADDRVTLLESTAVPETRFARGYIARVVAGAGHFVQRERPQPVLEAILEAAGA